jgi:hypothetical protein
MADNTHRCGGAVLVGVGAAFDFHVGTIARAPKWMRESGLEWAHRADISQPLHDLSCTLQLESRRPSWRNCPIGSTEQSRTSGKADLTNRSKAVAS